MAEVLDARCARPPAPGGARSPRRRRRSAGPGHRHPRRQQDRRRCAPRPSASAGTTPSSSPAAQGRDHEQELGGEHLVADGLFGAGTVGEQLPVRLRAPARAARASATSGPPEARGRSIAIDGEPGHLADQVVVRRAEQGTLPPAHRARSPRAGRPRVEPLGCQRRRLSKSLDAPPRPRSLGCPPRTHRARRSPDPRGSARSTSPGAPSHASANSSRPVNRYA